MKYKKTTSYKNGGPKNPPKQVTDPNDPSLKAYNDSLNLYKYGQDGLKLYKKGIQNLEELEALEKNHALADSIMRVTGIKPTAEMPQRYYELPKNEYGDPRVPKNTRAVGYSQYIFREPEQPVELVKKMGGHISKYRQPNFSSKHYKFGDYLADYGKTMLNIGVAPLETVYGRNFYDPEFKHKGFEGVSDVGAGMMGVATDAVGTYFGGQTYTMGKQVAQQTVNTLDPNQSLDNTRLEHQDETTYKIGKSLNKLSNTMTSSIGNSGVGVMKQGGMLTQYNTGGKHEENPIGGIPVGNALVEEGETQFNNRDYIFSDSLYLDKDLVKEFGLKGGKGLSFSKYSKKLDKQFGRESDKFDKNSKERMLNRLTDAQEAYKLTSFSNNFNNRFKMKMGGSLYKVLEEGGPLSETDYYTMFPGATIEEYTAYKEEFLNNSDVPTGALPYMKSKEGRFEMPAPNIQAPENVYKSGDSVPTLSTAGDPITESYNMNPMYDVLRAAPIVANTLSSLKYDKLDPNRYKVNNRITAPKINIDPLLAENRSGYATALSSLKGNAGGNAGAYMANLAGLNTGKYKADAAVYNNKFNLDSQNKFKADQLNLGVDQFNAESTFRTDDWNARSSEAAKNLQRKAAEQVGQFADAKSQEAFQEAYVDAVSENYDYDFTHYMPGTKKYKQKYGYRK